MADYSTGGFTLPGEAGYEALTLELAELWGADVIRDSDGTQLSRELLDAGYGVYSTICIIREHNEWAKQNRDKLQQTFLCTPVHTAQDTRLTIPLLESFFSGQFSINHSADAMRYWQVYDRTENRPLPSEAWRYDESSGSVTLDATPYHSYTASFLAWRIWEEISMYNHTTNNWDKEPLMQIDPVYPETRTYLLNWMREWCESHSSATVVRFTSLFYNFVWIWGGDDRCRNLFCDWGSYDFTVSPKMLDDFATSRGYSLTAEDFIDGGKLRSTHRPPAKRQRDYMDFVHDFVIGFGKQLIELVHSYGKQAYMFYDDSWVGTEPYSGRFREFGFDGLIKCVFSGYEARLCAGVDVPVHELRLHPYLFPVGLGGAPTFSEGGDPTRDAKLYWLNVRRALLRKPVERIGLGGYLHLTKGFPDFNGYIAGLAREFRRIKALHESGRPYTLPCRVAVLHCWGKLRSWTLSGHFHETHMFDLIHILEALSGLPVEVDFLDFDEVRGGALRDVDALLNAGLAGSAWSGGDAWRDPAVVKEITRWVYEGGAFIGIDEPSASEGFDSFLRLAPVLGVDLDNGARASHGRWQFEVQPVDGLLAEDWEIEPKPNILLTGGDTRVLAESGGIPVLTERRCGKGKGIYMSHFRLNRANTRTLLNLLLYASGQPLEQQYITDNTACECAWYPAGRTLAVINGSDAPQETSVQTEGGVEQVSLAPFEAKMIKL